MTTWEKIEVALIPVFGIIVWMFAPMLPMGTKVGMLLLWASALLLFQGLVRDLWLLHQARRGKPFDATRKLRCMCVESTLGVTGVVAGLVLLGTGSDYTVVMNRWGWSLSAVATMTIGFLVKDYVVAWNPWRVHRERDHLNVVFTWKT